MIRVTIAPGNPREISGIAKGTGKPYRFYTQTAYFHCYGRDGKPNAFPDKCEVIVDSADKAYAPGDYQLHPASVYVDRNGRPAMAPRLVPVTVKSSAT